MEQLSKLEKQLATWYENAPHLPTEAKKWLGSNVWWIVAVGAVLTAIGVLRALGSLNETITLLSGPAAAFYATPSALNWLITLAIISLVVSAIECVVLALAINPLKEKQKKGWTLLFIVWLVSLAYSILSAVLSFSFFSIIGGLILTAVFAAIGGYFLFEIRGQFAHVEKSAGVKKAAAPKVTK